GGDIAPEVDIELPSDLQVVRGPGVSHGVEQIDPAAAGNGDQRVCQCGLPLEFHRGEVKPGQRAHDFEVAQFLSTDVHEQIFAGRILAIETLDRILHGRGEFAISTAELL